MRVFSIGTKRVKKDKYKPLTDKRNVRSTVEKMRQEMELHGAESLESDKMTFIELAEKYEQARLGEAQYSNGIKVSGRHSIKPLQSPFKKLKEYFGSRPLRSIKASDVEAYKQKRLRTPVAITHNVKTKIENLPAGSRKRFYYKKEIRTRPRKVASVNRELELLRAMLNFAIENDWLVKQSAYAFAVGYVEIEGKSTLVNYKFSPSANSVSTNEGLFGVDVDGDGKIRSEAFSPESSYASKEAPFFRIGKLYVSIDSIDLERNLIAMRPRVAADYHRQELDIGTEMPDFAFVDFDGKKRSLGEFRKKYLLIDFWGLWCVDCRRELPYQLAAYKQFRSRGFEILGMNADENVLPVKEVLAKNGINWTQARLDSIKNLIEETYQIQEFPSAILLAPDGKVVVLDQHKLQGEELLKTLNQLLPK